MFNRPARAFTLIELLVVVAIIGLISSIALSALSTARTRAQYASARNQLRQLAQAMVIAQGESGRTMLQITNNGCSDCSCRNVGDMRNVASTHACYTRWTAALARVQANNSIASQALGTILRDPWGSPWMLDENEGEAPAILCRPDTLRTAGSDGLHNTSDDYIVYLPNTLPQCL
jgi:prepilin-type N-terminal cleavage/methylation domain-containing protein